ncbi:Stm1p ASCRUDRAFT_82744 [Ascoidea rubescens DSM 1968]|uniref:Hyaluronan/mRNA-binding protein domain-containing protein n=1 Tax=Ascoidea rubescens DSM 1968 TaxID=1344418 RepID=A0A1D2VAX3_9ASCO|nr:hypothetical protein ASCRUDRAFT_82744 [Ascoidea rubescens DSM 1968]ODV58603.1 hypothetical protein ASCRUDRAFT_82744 [Ascoidea rubescens DSM 1968]
MSFNKNPFDLLGNDQVEETSRPPLPKEIVKKTTSSKKADVAPTKTTRPLKNSRSKPTGNEAVFRSKDLIRNPNKTRPTDAPASTINPRRAKKDFVGDRQSRTGKTDSAKKIKQAWGDDDKELDTELAAAQDVAEEKVEEKVEGEGEEEEEPKETGPVQQTLEEYLASLKVETEGLAATPVRKANQGSESKWNANEVLVKEKEVFVESSLSKKVKSKSKKEKQHLDFEATFFDELPRGGRGRGGFRGRGGSRGGSRGGPRGGSRGGRGPFKGSRDGRSNGRSANPDTEKKSVVIDDANFPSLS